jgi:hypothetical protein
MNRAYLSSIKPFSRIFWRGVVVESIDEGGIQYIRSPYPKEEPDYYSVYIELKSGDFACVANFNTADEAALFVDLFEELHKNYTK